MKQTKVRIPLGKERGAEAAPAAAVKALAEEMFRRLESLREASQTLTAESQRMIYGMRIEDLEKYATALMAIAEQMQPGSCPQENIPALFDMAGKHNIALPDDFLIAERRKLWGENK